MGEPLVYVQVNWNPTCLSLSFCTVRMFEATIEHLGVALLFPTESGCSRSTARGGLLAQVLQSTRHL